MIVDSLCEPYTGWGVKHVAIEVTIWIIEANERTQFIPHNIMTELIENTSESTLGLKQQIIMFFQSPFPDDTPLIDQLRGFIPWLK